MQEVQGPSCLVQRPDGEGAKAGANALSQDGLPVIHSGKVDHPTGRTELRPTDCRQAQKTIKNHRGFFPWEWWERLYGAVGLFGGSCCGDFGGGSLSSSIFSSGDFRSGGFRGGSSWSGSSFSSDSSWSGSSFSSSGLRSGGFFGGFRSCLSSSTGSGGYGGLLLLLLLLLLVLVWVMLVDKQW
jgi:hypothetical protein